MSTSLQARAWLRVRADALRRNCVLLRRSAGSGAQILPMVKADGYGLGMRGVVEALGQDGVWGWGVATLPEGLRLRESRPRDPVVVFAPLQPSELEAALGAGLHVCISSLAALEHVVSAASRLGVDAKVHVDVDTGMGRTGFDWRTAPEWMPRVQEAVGAGVQWVGCFTHLHSAEDDEESAHAQWTRFREALAALTEPPDGLIVHVLNSPGTFRVPAYAADAVRPGIFLYGGRVGPHAPVPTPVVSLHARVCHVRDAPRGTTLGYGATYRAAGDERWATLSIGYGDGLPRSLGNRGSVILAGVRQPIIGRISMDLTVVDISDVSGVQVGDVATLLGAEGQEEITLDELAELAGTISYEILTGFTPRLPRIWTDSP